MIFLVGSTPETRGLELSASSAVPQPMEQLEPTAMPWTFLSKVVETEPSHNLHTIGRPDQWPSPN